VCGAQGGICGVNIFFQSRSLLFFPNAKDLSAPSYYRPIIGGCDDIESSHLQKSAIRVMRGKMSNDRNIAITMTVLIYEFCVAGKLVFKLMSSTTLYSVIILTLITVGTVLTLKERVVKLSVGATLEEAIIETDMSSGFMLLLLLPFLHCTEIWKRIQFINSWGIFQVNLLMFFNTKR
jgi:hypothetical protein